MKRLISLLILFPGILNAQTASYQNVKTETLYTYKPNTITGNVEVYKSPSLYPSNSTKVAEFSNNKLTGYLEMKSFAEVDINTTYENSRPKFSLVTQIKSYDPYTPILEMFNNLNIDREFQYRKYSKSKESVINDDNKRIMTLHDYYVSALKNSLDVKTLKKGKYYGYLYLQNKVLARIGVKINSKGKVKFINNNMGYLNSFKYLGTSIKAGDNFYSIPKNWNIKKNLGNIQIKVWDYDGYSSASFIYEALGKIIFVKDYSKLTF